jgi:hypothetical protein
MSSSTSFTNIKVFPKQKIADSKKDEQWGKDCIDAAEALILTKNQYSRSSRYTKQINYDLYNGILHASDLEIMLNPSGIKEIAFPAQVDNHPIINPYIKSLIGEEIKRRFDFIVKVENEDAISKKEEAKKEEIMALLEQILLEGLEEPEQGFGSKEEEQAYQEEVQKRLLQKQKYLNYEWRDIRELSATRLLNYYEEKEELRSKFTQGWEDATIAGEEIYSIDIIANEPVVRKCNPLNTYFLLPPDSNRVEDSDVIIEENYWPVGKVIDFFYEDLKPADIDTLHEKIMYKGGGNYGGIPNYQLQDPVWSLPVGILESNGSNSVISGNYNSLIPYDSQSNVRVVKAVWKSTRKIGELTYLDEAGEAQKTYVPETYVVNEALGETVKWLWISEWWEGWKVANEFYLKVRPREVQFRSLNNLSKCASGYVGTIYKTNSNIAQSLLEIMKPYQYLYNLIYHKTKEAFAKNIGKVANLDLAKLPDEWKPEQWLYYLKTMNIAVTDSFKEAKKGAAIGKLAGNMSGSQNTMDLDMGNYIQQHIEMLEYIKRELDLVTGISPERRGERTSADPGLGVTQENKLASANITEWYFRLHDNTKTRVYAALLETAKYCLRNGNKTIQYITDEMTSEIFKIDGEMVNECEYGLFVTDSVEEQKAIEMLRSATEIAMQTGQVDVIQLMDIYSNKSLSSIRRKIERSVESSKEVAMQQAQAEQEQIKAIEDQKAQIEMAKLELKQYEIDQNNMTKIAIAEMTAYAIDDGGDAALIDNTSEMALKQQEISQKVYMEGEKIRNDREIKEKELELKKRESEQKLAIERKKLEQIDTQNKSQEKIKQLDVQMKEKELKMKEKLELIKLRAARAKARTASKSKSK